MDDDLRACVEARRKRIKDAAKCKNCGTTLEECRAFAGDATGPEGLCCGSCHHVESLSDLHKLVDEMLTGTVAPPSDWRPGAVLGPLNDRPRRPPVNWLVHQSEWWRPRDGRLVRIADMDPHWRYNTAALLLRNAQRHAGREASAVASLASGPLGPSGDAACDAVDHEIKYLCDRSGRWMQGTRLYRALISGLPRDSESLELLQKQARHWGACPVRHGADDDECTCPDSTYGEDHAE
jgi:hypothetical protein